MRTLNLEQFAREFGGVTDADVQGHIHGALGPSGRKSKAMQRRFQRRFEELQAQRDETRERYRAALAAGEFKAPAPVPLEQVAAAAARRVLAKRAARRNAG
mgnify:CR=1 FL=1